MMTGSFRTAAFVAVCIFAMMGGGARADTPVRSKLYQTSRARLALARAQGARMFSVILASAPGKNAEVAAAVRAMGGTILWRGDDVDFLEAKVPIGRVEALAVRNDVFAIDADDSITVLTPPSPPPTPVPSPIPTVSPSPKPRTAADEAPLLHPYIPGRDIQTSALRAAHPSYDGRGVTVAVVDGTPDFLLPELQYAKASDGENIPKFLDIRTAEIPTDTDDYSVWLTTQPVQTVGKKFTVGGVSYTAPYDGAFRFAAVSDQKLYQYIWKTIEPDTTFAKGKVLFGILWDESNGTVWVDSKRNHNFGDEPGLRDYAVHHDYGTFPVKVKDPQARPTIGFVVQTDPASHRVAVLFADGSHATGSVGSVAASREGGGRIEGIAPGARLYSITPGDNASSIIEAVIEAARNPSVDEVDLEFISALAYALRDGHFTESVIFDRVTRHYGKPIFQPADNDFGMSKVSESCGSPLVFCIGAYENRDSYLINSGIAVSHRDNLHFVDSFGPSGTGALRPEVLSPSGWISLSLGYTADRTALKGVYNLPPGFTIFGGTSQATPTAAGAIAVLLGAARQEQILATPERLITAVAHTARYLPNLPAYVQGNGLIQIASALQWLERTNGKALVHLSFTAPVRTVTSWSLPVPHRGVGLFEREGWIAGMRGNRIVRITRENGMPSSELATVELVGNDGTFTNAKNVALPLQRSIALNIGIAPRTSGAHSAILRLHSNDGMILGETLLTVVAGESFTSRNGYSIEHHIDVPRPGETSMFITVPRNAQALVVRVASPRKGIEYNAWLPDSTQSLNVSNNLLIGFPLSAGTRQDVFPHPQPGTWELVFGDLSDDFTHEKRHVSPTPVVVAASLVGVAVAATPAGLLVHAAQAAAPTLTVTRQTAGVASSASVIRSGEQRVYAIHVPAGSTGVGANVQSSSGSLVHLYLFDCTKSAWKKCMIKTKSTEASSMQHLYYDRPAPGLWKLIVDGYMASPHGTPYTLQRYYLEGLPLAARLRGVSSAPSATFGTLGNDPDIYYNEADIGEIKPRDGLNPIIFDVQFFPRASY